MIRVIVVKGNGIGANCKITTYADQRITYSFGNGRNEYCLTASYDPKYPDMVYMDRVEKKECFINMKTEDIEEPTAKLVRLALYTIYKENPDINKITLRDDSYIYCKGDSGPKISIAFDYLIKYNKTWYQRKFGAILPGFREMDGIIHIDSGSPMDLYLNSISNLDKPCITYEEIIEKFQEIKKYRDEYESSTSPRDFIDKLRNKYGPALCFEMASWFNRYFVFLGIRLFFDLWYIPISAIKPPINYRVTEPSAKNKDRILQGGNRNRTKKSNRWTGIKPFYDEGSIVVD